MAVLIFTQTQNDAPSGASAGSSGYSLAGTPQTTSAVSGGTPGTTNKTTEQAGSTTVATFMIQASPGVDTWQEGDYIVRLNVTKTTVNVVWVATYICERTTGGAFNTVASLTGQTETMNAIGVHTMTITRSGGDFTPNSSDSTLYIVCVFNNTHKKQSRGISILPNQDVDTPIDDGILGDTAFPDILNTEYYLYEPNISTKITLYYTFSDYIEFSGEASTYETNNYLFTGNGEISVRGKSLTKQRKIIVISLKHVIISFQ